MGVGWQTPADVKAFGAAIRGMRERRGLSPICVAILVGFPIQYYLDMEAGTKRRHLQPRQVDMLAWALGVTPFAIRRWMSKRRDL
jgi:hypothetical protein